MSLEKIERVRRCFVEKKRPYAVEAERLKKELADDLGLNGLRTVRVLNRYDISGLTDEEYEQTKWSVFAEVQLDDLYEETVDLPEDAIVIGVEALPGQFDQRADSAAQCVQLLTHKERPPVKSARVYVFEGGEEGSSREELRETLTRFLINPVECREAAQEKPATLDESYEVPGPVPILDGFTRLNEIQLKELRHGYGLAMSEADLLFTQEYFANIEGRDPTETELRVLDTYWSDHCRHTTFLTQLNEIEFAGSPYGDDTEFIESLAGSYTRYLDLRKTVHGERLKDKPVCLMDLATIAMKKLRADGLLQDLDESDEINACSIKVRIEVDGRDEDYLIMFKNETHNHPTEIEPFGGAATCLGGAIRDPLSGRSYVYQAMRVTGSANPNIPVSETLPGKLPQRVITKGAADGYSSYGNQIGLATGQVHEVYHNGYMAKRLEIGAVIAAAPAEQVQRSAPEPGDVVILVGGRTGRDGCGGATGSSKAHSSESGSQCGSEVQKGNPPVERKLQRLFRDPQAARLIRRCNDFGAGGVCVAIGELAPGLEIDLDKVPLKYKGLNGTELAISESQERMAVVVRKEHEASFIELADKENLEATTVAVVTGDGRMIMRWRGEAIVDLSRDFIDSNGAPQETNVLVHTPSFEITYFRPPFNGMPFAERLKRTLGSLNCCSQKGLMEQFDSTIGAATVLMPFGGRWQDSPEEGMVARIPVENGKTDAVSLMSYGFDPNLSSWSPYHGAWYAILHSISKLTAMGGSPSRARLSLQEYFPRIRGERHWGLPLAALLGALDAQLAFGVPAIGGKDSMSGTYENMEVPPTLVSFAVGTRRSNAIHSATLTAVNSALYYIPVPKDEYFIPDADRFMTALRVVHTLQKEGRLHCTATVDGNGVAARVAQMCFGNRLGFSFNGSLPEDLLFTPDPGGIIVEVPQERLGGSTIGRLLEVGALHLGQPASTPVFTHGDEFLPLEDALKSWQETLAPVFPAVSDFQVEGTDVKVPTLTRTADPAKTQETTPPVQLADRVVGRVHLPEVQPMQGATPVSGRPTVLIPVFPGTNCEYDTATAFHAAGGDPDIFVFRNLSPKAIAESIDELVRRIAKAQIIMLPGGFSAGDEPEGSGKFIANVFRNPAVTEAVRSFLQQKDGLMLGICNGFQALIKLGLVTYGDIVDAEVTDPTLTFNTVGRHVSTYVDTRVVDTSSPWLHLCRPGEVYSVPVSHGEGRFVAGPAVLETLRAEGRIATQYVDLNGRATASLPFNPNGSAWAIEGITSPDGRVFGKMGHSERVGRAVAINIPGNKQMPIFEAGVRYFKI